MLADACLLSNLATASYLLAENIKIWGSLAYLGSGMAAIGCVGSGIGQGMIGAKSVESIGRNPEVESKIRLQMIISAAITESGSIYALVVAIILAFVVSGIGQPAGS